MIFAKVDVTLGQHHRVLRIPKDRRATALGVWLLALLYTRGNDLDGFAPKESVDMVATDQAIEDLVTVGLLSAHEHEGVHGYLIYRYAEHNETKRQVQRRRNATKKRVRKHRGNGVTGKDVTRTEVAFVPGSDSDSGSDQRSSERVQGEGRATLPPADIPVTERVKLDCSAAGARQPSREDVIACLANARSKGHLRADWEAYLVSWMVRGKRLDRPTTPELPPDAPARRRLTAAK